MDLFFCVMCSILVMLGYGMNMLAGSMYRESTLYQHRAMTVNVLIAATILVPFLTGVTMLFVGMVVVIRSILNR